jgi:hypothetical protein
MGPGLAKTIRKKAKVFAIPERPQLSRGNIQKGRDKEAKE